MNFQKLKHKISNNNLFKSNQNNQVPNQTNIFKPKNYINTGNLKRISLDIEYILTNEKTLIKSYKSKEKFDWDLYIILYCSEKLEYNIIPKVLNVVYKDEEKKIEMDISRLYSLEEFFLIESISQCHLLINELVSFIKFLKINKIQVNNMSMKTIFIDKEEFRFYLIDTSNITFGDYLNTGVQMLNIDIEESNIKKEIKTYFRNQLGLYGNVQIFENIVSDIISLYSYD